MIQAAGPVPGIGWTVTAALPSSVALAPARNFLRSLQITLGVALLLVLLFTPCWLCGSPAAGSRSRPRSAALRGRCGPARIASGGCSTSHSTASSW